MQSGTTTYLWDGNGNRQSAANTVNTAGNKSFTYNLLNLPLVVTNPLGTITYTYDATGDKLRKVSVQSGTTKTTDYISGIEYDNSTTVISFIQTEEGKAVPNDATAFDYNYYLGDNLGNTRVTFGTKTGAAVLYQQDDYYPFGLEINRTPYIPKNEYLYNKKELQEEFTEYDYGARFYDPVLGRWTSVDPLAEKSRKWSTYNYAEDNPIRMIDPDGMEVVYANDDSKKSYENYKKDVNTKISNAQTKIDANKDKGFFGKLFSGFYGAKSELKTFSNISKELNAMESTQDVTYNISTGVGMANSINGQTSYNTSTNQIDVSIKENDPSKNEGTLAHELKHGYQFLVGEVDFDSSGQNGGDLYGKEDEQAAVQRGDEVRGTQTNPDAVNEAYSNGERKENGGSLKSMTPAQRAAYYEAARAKGLIYNRAWEDY